MKFKLNTLIVVYLLFLAMSFFFGGSNICFAFNVNNFIENSEKNDKQTVLTGHIDTLVIIRGNAEFHLGPGELTLFDFGWEKPSAMVYSGEVNFVYSPPDEIERYQLKKFTGKDTLKSKFESICFFYTVDLDNMPDTSLLTSKVVDKRFWEILKNAQDDAFDHLAIYMPNKLIGDFISEGSGTFFYADFRIKKFEHLVFCEDPYKDDHYGLYKLRRSRGYKTYDVYGGYSPEKNLISQRGLKTIDITHYNINSRIESDGKMTVQCRIHFTPLRWDRRFLYFYWYYKNKINSAIDSNGDSLSIINKKDENGFGLILNNSMMIGEEKYIDIDFECESLINIWGVFYVRGQAYWYPNNITNDRATFELLFNCPKNLQIICCGEQVESQIEEERNITKWIEDTSVSYVSFNIGIYDSKEVILEGFPPVKVYMSKNIPHKELAHILAYYGELSTSDMLGTVTNDVINSLSFFNALFGPCPFETIKATEIPFRYGQGSPGLILLSWSTYQFEDLVGSHQQFRAHEVAHQWWGHIVDNESYRDTWIIEGLAEYCGSMYYQSLVKDIEACKNVLTNWRRYIFAGSGGGSMGTKAGPMTLGYRLNSSKSTDYIPVIYMKGAYVFHMLRYLLHDYRTDTDDKFIDLLRDLINKYKDKPITTPQLKELIENHTQTDMNWFFDQWVYGIDIPEYRFSYDYEKTPEGKYQVTCHVKQDNVFQDFKMVVPLTVPFENGQYTHLKIRVDQPQQNIDLPLLPLKPKKIEFNTYDAVLCNVKYG